MKRYLLAVFIVFVIMAIGIVLLGGGSDQEDTPVNNSSQPVPKQLHDYAESSTARVVYTTQGKVVGDDQYSAIRVTVTRDVRRIEILDGYNNRVEKAKSFPNNQRAFDIFLRSLEHAGYAKQRDVALTDDRGVCPGGRRFIYEMYEAREQVQRLWSATCGKELGTFDGSAHGVSQLFRGQITDYSRFISGVSL